MTFGIFISFDNDIAIASVTVRMQLHGRVVEHGRHNPAHDAWKKLRKTLDEIPGSNL